jgi:hypothetical protein
MGLGWTDLILPGSGYAKDAYEYAKGKVGGLTEEPESAKQQRQNLENQGGMASWFADVGQQNYGAMSAEAAAAREAMRRRATGQDSLSAEQLRQGLGQQLAMQRSMAAGAAPQNQAMAARNAAIQMGRASSGMSGQAAMAGIQERSQAEKALADMITQQRGQDLSAALGSRQNAISGYGGGTPEKSTLERYAPLIQAGTGAAAMAASDRRLKKDVKDADDESKRILKGLGTYSYRYKDSKHGEGDQFGVMAQSLEKHGLKHAVIDTPEGKMVHGAKAALSSLGLVAALGRRVEKLEGGKK